MVKSGLNEENLYVSHIRLAVHFVAALGLLVYTIWFALQLLIPRRAMVVSKPLYRISMTIAVLLVLQLVYGAFMAGLKAGPYAPTWPDINGAWWPASIHKFTGLKNWTDNPIAVHFIHRGLAYLLTLFVLAWTLQAARLRASRLFRQTRWLPMLVILLQVLLGIMTVLNSPQPKALLWFGVAHQFVAMLFLLVMTSMLYLIRNGGRQV
jgi:cytochrome c oxidase assembly protein subunit 15